MNLKRNVYTVAAAAVLIAGLASMAAESHASSGQEVPKLQVDPAWPRMPNGWSWGQVSSAACDDHDNIWILQRPKSVRPDQKAGPPVMEFDKDGKLIRLGRVTVFHNGVLVQDNVEILGPTVTGEPDKPHAEKLPLGLQDHNHPVRFRNVWLRELAPAA